MPDTGRTITLPNHSTYDWNETAASHIKVILALKFQETKAQVDSSCKNHQDILPQRRILAFIPQVTFLGDSCAH